jgi:cell division cycle 14
MSATGAERTAVEVLPGRLYYLATNSVPVRDPKKHYFSIDNVFIYWNFFLDFGPLNMGHVYRFCLLLNGKLADPKLKDKVIYYYSGSNGQRRANAVHLICCWQLLCLGRSPEEAFAPFRSQPPFPSWHDATPTVCSFQLTILDTLRGLAKARTHKFFDLDHFDIEEYEHYELVENGDLNWLADGKFVAFAGPHSAQYQNEYHNLPPESYVPYFKKKGVKLVVRLNKKYYDARSFTKNGINHVDMYFLDGSNPPEHILQRFLEMAEHTDGGVAVHCKAGLGRTGCVIGCYLMKHYKITAAECIGWFRIVRPGCIIGPQQYWLTDMQDRMWREGDVMRARLRGVGPAGREGGGSERAVNTMTNGMQGMGLAGSAESDAKSRTAGVGAGTAEESRSSRSAQDRAAEAREARGDKTQGDLLRAARAQQQRDEAKMASGRAGTMSTLSNYSKRK